MSPTTLYPDLPFVRAGGDGGPRPVTQVVCIHATDNTASAAAEASYAQTRPDKTSAHFYADEQQVIQAVDLSHIAYGCLYHGNRISIQLELCGLSNHIGDATLRWVAPVVARVCRDWGIPVRKIGAGDVSAGTKGICGHADITAAFPQDNGDHTDPGAQFPWSTFISYIEGGDVDETERKAGNADAWGAALVEQAPSASFYAADGKQYSTPNKLAAELAAIKTAVQALAAPPPIVLTDAQVAAIAQQLGGTLGEILARLKAAGHALDSDG